MAHEGRGHTLQAAALVHEAYMRMAGGQAVDWQDRALAFAARSMRQVLMEYARQRRAGKRGDEAADRVSISMRYSSSATIASPT